MLQAMSRLTTKNDVLRIVITLLACLAIWFIIEAFVASWRGVLVVPLIFVGLFLVILYVTAHSIFVRAKKLLAGRCPHPLCHGTVHHSENVPKGYLICPTCKNKWPEVKGIKYRASGREH